MIDEADVVSQLPDGVGAIKTEKLGNDPEFNIVNEVMGPRTWQLLGELGSLAKQLFGAPRLTPDAQQALYTQVDRFLETARPQLELIEAENERGPLTKGLTMLSEQLAAARANPEAARVAPEGQAEQAPAQPAVRWPKNPLGRLTRSLFSGPKK